MAEKQTNTTYALSHAEVRSVIIGVMLAILLGALDQTIVSVSLPKMSTDLMGVDLLAWVVSGYLIAATVATPIYGKLGDLYGRRLMLSLAIGTFLVASILCALAPSMPFMVAARILQGLGGGGLISVAQAIVGDVVSPRERGRYQGYISGAFALASVFGPVLGGLLTEYLSWRWIFWINLPLCLVAFIISHRALARLPKPVAAKRQIDYLGALLLTIGLTSLLIGITRVGDGTSWIDPANLQLFAVAVVSTIAFVWQEQRTAEPIIPLTLFRSSTVTLCCALMFIAFIQIISLSVLIPLRLQMLTDFGADGAALQLLPMSVAVPLGSFIAGKLTTRTGRYKQTQLAGAIIVPVMVLILGFSSPESVTLNVFCMIAAGLAIGLQLPTSLVAIQNAVEYRHMGVATSLGAFSRSLGAAVGIALLMALLLASLQSHAPESLTSISGGEIIKLMVNNTLPRFEAGAPSEVALSVMSAFRHVFIISAVIAAFAVVLSFLMADETLTDHTPQLKKI